MTIVLETKLQRFLSTVPIALEHPRLTYRSIRHDVNMMLGGPPYSEEHVIGGQNIAYSWHAEYRSLVLGWIIARLSRKNLPQYQREYLDQLHVLLITVHITED